MVWGVGMALYLSLVKFFLLVLIDNFQHFPPTVSQVLIIISIIHYYSSHTPECVVALIVLINTLVYLVFVGYHYTWFTPNLSCH